MGLIVDLFAGGGGASTGIEWALGRSPDIAINHDPMALAMHKANHPTTKHYVENVWHVRPRDIVGDTPVDLLWASPDCTHFSKAKGAAPKRDINRAKRSRGLAWVILRWAREACPRLILMENVEEWVDWCPVGEDGRPDPKRKGETRKRFVRELQKLGYQVHIERKDKACDHGAPTIRQRLVMVARCDGAAINVPKRTHGRADGVRDLFAPKVEPYRTAAEIIDWEIPCPSIFSRHLVGKKELAPATKRRIARGMTRYVINSANPFIVPVTHAGADRVHPITEPLRTITTAHRGEMALAQPYLVGTAHGEGHGRGKADWSLDLPFGTVTCSSDRALIAPFTAGVGGPSYGGKPRAINQPFKTVLNENHAAVIAPFLARYDQSSAADRNGIHPATEPVRTITTLGVGGVVGAFLAGCGGRAAQSGERTVNKPFGTLTAKADQIVVAPCIVNYHSAKRTGDDRARAINVPLPTQTTENRFGVAAAFMAQHNKTKTGYNPGRPMDVPMSTIVNSGSHQNLVAATITHLRGGGARYGFSANAPLPALTAQGTHVGLSTAFLTKYYKEGSFAQAVTDPLHTVTSKPRFSLVTTSAGEIPMTEEDRYAAWWVARFIEDYTPINDNKDGRPPVKLLFPEERPAFVCAVGIPIIDIGMRMLELRELYRAQGFPEHYIIAPKVYRIVRNKLVFGPLPKTDGTRMCGNSVSPYQARAWIIANAPPEFYAPGWLDVRRAA